MESTRSIYSDIARRTGGEIYVGVVGPVRTGKSTFIKRFMEQLVLPHITDDYERERARDEMPQSSAGKTVMTTEPKFVPDRGVEIALGDGAKMKVKLCDCVGYMVPDAIGAIENGSPRMVMTPWSENAMPFETAAEIGTRKVISEHSTVGILVTTDGTIGEIRRSAYEDAEKRVAEELRALGKPFAILLNSARPETEEAQRLAVELERKYGAPVALLSVPEINADDIRHLMELLLLEFPIRRIDVELPSWTTALDSSHWLKEQLEDSVYQSAAQVRKLGELGDAFNALFTRDYIRDAMITSMDCGTGIAQLEIRLTEPIYYKVISELTGFEITDEEGLINQMKELSAVKVRYDKIRRALDEVEANGYGIVMPGVEDLKLEEPQIIRKSGSYGVRLRAAAPSVHMIRADIETEINPIVGTEQQSEDLIRYLMSEFDEDPAKIWSSRLFGKTIYELMTEGLHTKLDNMPADARKKLGETLEKIVNEGTGGLICILL
ncbi:MAG: stage IV sporulation protein A [Clostridia bacterium]|nr:stage IV sporulation protein A [Clostridia bacterium]